MHNPVGWVDPFGLAGCSHDAKILRENMEAAGKVAPAYKNSAHHIIMSNSNDVRMRWLRRKIDRMELDINSAENGIFLPTSSAVKTSIGTSLPAHSTIHTNVYKQNVFDRLKNIKEPNELLSELNNISNDIVKGIFNF